MGPGGPDPPHTVSVAGSGRDDGGGGLAPLQSDIKTSHLGAPGGWRGDYFSSRQVAGMSSPTPHCCRGTWFGSGGV